MKFNYIKTTKGIWEISKLSQTDYEWLLKSRNLQAENLEDLINRYIVKGKCFYRVLRKLQFKKLSKAKRNEADIFGAIWTVGNNNEPILKAVAKFNDKGELELI